VGRFQYDKVKSMLHSDLLDRLERERKNVSVSKIAEEFLNKQQLKIIFSFIIL